jgi:hypothetical protein
MTKELKKDYLESDKDRLKKEAAIKANAPKPKLYFDVKVECTLPATLTYRVLAEDAEQAAELIKNMQPVAVKHRLAGKRELSLKVFLSGTNMMKFMKKMFGG